MPGWIPHDSTTHFSQDDFLHWLGAELGPCGLDVALPAGSILEKKSGEIVVEICWDWKVENWLPSGNLLHSYGKWPFIIDLPIQSGDFQ